MVLGHGDIMPSHASVKTASILEGGGTGLLLCPAPLFFKV